MIEFKDDGTVTIEFGDPTGLVTIRPPKFGAFKRLRAERERLAQQLLDDINALPDLGVIPAADDPSEEAKAERARITPLFRERVRLIEEMTAETLAKTWRFILIGDDTFAGLASPKPPDDPDEWPTELLIDSGEFEIVDGVRMRTNPTVIDQFFLHVGRARYRSGVTALPSS